MTTSGLLLLLLLSPYTLLGFPVPKDDWDNINILDHLEFNEYRNIAGLRNNRASPFWGAASTGIVHCIAPEYGDGFSTPSGDNRESPREISNVLFTQTPEESPKFVNDRHLTQFAWQWGQFIDHDITLIQDDTNPDDLSLEIDIYVPCCDPAWDAECVCDADIFINMYRSVAVEESGTAMDNPRTQVNTITAFIDGSSIYGSDSSRQSELRLYSDGLMKTSLSENGETLLPFNVNNIPNAPNSNAGNYIGGDLRVNEHLGLLAMHTIFVRAHNAIANIIKNGVSNHNPTASSTELDEKIYQYTKLIITAIMQKITYSDWLPVLFGKASIDKYLQQYRGYDENVNPGICVSFAGAAFRYGHSEIPKNLPLRDAKCKHVKGYSKDMSLSSAFFRSDIMYSTPYFIESMINGYLCTLCNEVDPFVTDSLRNFLFKSAVDENGEAIFGVLDLVSLNIQRGRDQGICNYNEMRKLFGMDEMVTFDDISDNQVFNDKLAGLYHNDINNVDAFPAMLSETHLTDSSFGESITKIVLTQFAKLRDGDRFYYKNYIRDGILREWIDSVTLNDILELTTNIQYGDINQNLDDNNNIFQNIKAISIFDKTKEFPRDPSKSSKKASKPSKSSSSSSKKDRAYVYDKSYDHRQHQYHQHNQIHKQHGITSHENNEDHLMVIRLSTESQVIIYIVIAIIVINMLYCHFYKKENKNEIIEEVSDESDDV